MNVLIPLALIAIVFVYIGFKWNNFRTKMAFFFIIFGVLFVLFFAFMIITGSSFNFSSVGDVFSSVRGYLVWIKNAAVSIFTTTGKAVGYATNHTG